MRELILWEVDLEEVDLVGVDLVGMKLTKRENLHYRRLITVALIIQVQNQKRSICLISNMRFLDSCVY